jgi:hypothetical protein
MKKRFWISIATKATPRITAYLLGGGGLLGFLSQSTAQAQVDCSLPAVESVSRDEVERGVSCGGNNPLSNAGGDFDMRYSQQSFWIPASNTPTLTIPIAIHIFQDNLGQGSFTDIPSTYGMLEQVMTWVNGIWSAGQPSSDPQPWQTTCLDPKVQFELAGRIFFYPATGLQTDCSLSAKMNYVLANFPERMRYLGIYSVLPGNCGQFAYTPSPSWYNGNSSSAGLNDYLGIHVNLGINDEQQFSNAVTIAHELGHCMDLYHLYEPSCCHESCSALDRDYLYDVFGPTPISGCWFNSCSGNPDPWAPGNSVTNNEMNGCGIAYPQGYWLSELQAGRIHRALAVKNLKDYAYDAHSGDPLVVAQDQTWNFEMRLYQDVVIEPGATLTLTCQLEMPTAGKIIVKQNGRLIVDGGVITTARYSDTFWSGIEVWGTTDQHQFPEHHPTHQGLLVLKNGAVIEHAREGFTNWKPQDWNAIGGVIQVQGTPEQVGATFRNCRRAAGFMAYQNFQPGNPGIQRPNTSYFKYAHFTVDDDYRGGNDFEAHVTMWKVDGIQFRACAFENAQTAVPSSTQLGEGIYSIDANYTVGGNCTVTFPNCCPPCPPESLDKGRFIGLGHGIDARDSGSGRGFTVQDCVFENNVVGVYTDGLSTFTVAKNAFILGDRDVALDGVVDENFQEDHHRGVSTQRSYGFRIEENTFSRAANVSAQGVSGIVIENSLEHNTQVYKNQAAGMDEGYIGEGRCMDHMQASSVGLQFLCNTNSGNQQNFRVRKDDDGTATNLHSIRTQQGSDASPAGNTFDQEVAVLDESDYRNETAWVINYWHSGGQGEPMDFTPGWFGKTLTTGTNGCPSKQSGKEVRMTPGRQEQVAGELQAAKAAYISTAYVFNSLLDGGNTDAVIEEVQQSWPSEAWELRQYLLSKSPYLSTEVLKEMMLRNTLPQAMVLEICLANPEATKKEGFVKWAEFEAPHPLPAYMIDLIAGSWAPKTFRMQLEAQMGQHHAAMSAAADMLQDALRSDEQEVHPAAALAVWQQLPNYGARYGEIAARLRLNDFGGARAVLNGLQAAYPMKEDRAAERDRALWYVDQLEALHTSGRQLPQLTAAEVAQWQAFALAAGDRPGTWAANALCFFHEVCIGRGGGPTIGNKSLRPAVPADAGAQAAPALALLPNPASTWVTLAYEINDQVENAHARIMDARGRQVAIFTIANAQGQQVWDTRQVPAGVYSVELFNNGQRVDTRRLIVQPQP